MGIGSSSSGSGGGSGSAGGIGGFFTNPAEPILTLSPAPRGHRSSSTSSQSSSSKRNNGGIGGSSGGGSGGGGVGGSGVGSKDRCYANVHVVCVDRDISANVQQTRLEVSSGRWQGAMM